mmetsp:Transcript_29780/g.28650  ORF Transcript_29780/g.28650 Transcript_29780/m.28650 type:complete len:172 (-) Transcript_29780:12-527(-)
MISNNEEPVSSVCQSYTQMLNGVIHLSDQDIQEFICRKLLKTKSKTIPTSKSPTYSNLTSFFRKSVKGKKNKLDNSEITDLFVDKEKNIPPLPKKARLVQNRGSLSARDKLGVLDWMNYMRAKGHNIIRSDVRDYIDEKYGVRVGPTFVTDLKKNENKIREAASSGYKKNM